MMNEDAKHVFISYVHEDSDQVDKLCSMLDAAHIPYWRDRTSLAHGDQWKHKIREAIRSHALVFLACFSENSNTKSKSYMNEELTLAVEEFRKFPPGATWLIPVRFDSYDLPEWDLGAGRSLSDLNYANLFGSTYMTEAISLTATISRVMGSAVPNPATVKASVVEAAENERPDLLRRMTKEMILNPARRIELDDLITQEVNQVLAAMRDEERFPNQLVGGSSNEDLVVNCAEIAASYWTLAAPICASLQVAARWGDATSLSTWVSALRAIAAEAGNNQGGNVTLLNLKYIPALTAVFSTALASIGQPRWDNLKTLLVDPTVSNTRQGVPSPLIQAINPWSAFEDLAHLLPNVVARSAITGKDARISLREFTSQKTGKYKTPVAEWLHAILRPLFTDQYPDDPAYSEAFDRTEVVLGLISQDIALAASGGDPDRLWMRRSEWFGRSTWRSHHGRGGALVALAAEIEAQASGWPPLAAGLFAGDATRVEAAFTIYSEDFNKMALSR
ncbi:toll/interleukin-1 receptor domain-containing protein [Actinokineospora bangkokensis]|uniref:toll/interleukin-1 receptor domain-containing protein n=1 Tax=Actinokineospora bangkokensis TaxID=1193682 RepID=UPI000A02C479|nr:toll/interleukin-1 receptor domain-containing protein [Actinokineospora bangkokensis]